MTNLNNAFEVAEKYLDIPKMLDAEGKRAASLPTPRRQTPSSRRRGSACRPRAALGKGGPGTVFNTFFCPYRCIYPAFLGFFLRDSSLKRSWLLGAARRSAPGSPARRRPCPPRLSL